MPVSLDLRTLFLIFSVTCSRFNIQTSRNTWLVSSPCIPTTIALGPRRVHLVSRVSTVRSPSTERVYFIASVSRHLLARRSLIPFPSGRGRSVTSAPSTSRSPSSPSQSVRLAGISPSLISLAPVAAARGKASCSCTSLDCHSPISIRCPTPLPSLRFALSLRSDRPRLLTSHV